MGFCANTSWDRCAFPENASAHYHMETLKTYTSKPLNISLKEQLLFNRLCRKNFPKISEVTVVSIALCVKLIYVVRAFVEGCSWSGNSVTHKTPFHAKKVKASQTHLHTFVDGSPKFQCNLKVSSRCIIHSFFPTWPMFFIFYFIPYGVWFTHEHMRIQSRHPCRYTTDGKYWSKSTRSLSNLCTCVLQESSSK